MGEARTGEAGSQQQSSSTDASRIAEGGPATAGRSNRARTGEAGSQQQSSSTDETRMGEARTGGAGSKQ
jgi:hypothetical protein